MRVGCVVGWGVRGGGGDRARSGRRDEKGGWKDAGKKEGGERKKKRV